MGCGCGRPAAAGARSVKKVQGWLVTSAAGVEYGPYLTQMEARQTLTMIGGGAITPVYSEAA